MPCASILEAEILAARGRNVPRVGARAHYSPGVRFTVGLRFLCLLGGWAARPFNTPPAGRSFILWRDQALLDVALPRFVVLHAPLGLLASQAHLLGDKVDSLRAVELLVVWDSGRAQVNLVSALPLVLNVFRGLPAA